MEYNVFFETVWDILGDLDSDNLAGDTGGEFGQTAVHVSYAVAFKDVRTTAQYKEV